MDWFEDLHWLHHFLLTALWVFLKLYLSLVGETIGADDALVVLNRGFRIALFILAPKVHIIQAKPFRVALIPFKLVKQ